MAGVVGVGLLLLQLPARPEAQRADSPATPAIGLVVSADDPGSAARVEAARAALDAARAERPGLDVELRVGSVRGPWSDGARVAADLVSRQGCIALLTPPDRDLAHLVAQVGNRMRVPVVTLSADSSLTRVGSPWIFRPVPDARAQLDALVRDCPPPTGRLLALLPEGREGDALALDVAAVAAAHDLQPRIARLAAGRASYAALAALDARSDEPLALWLPADGVRAVLAARAARRQGGPLWVPRDVLAADPRLARAAGAELHALRIASPADDPAGEAAAATREAVRRLAAAIAAGGREPARLRERLAAPSEPSMAAWRVVRPAAATRSPTHAPVPR